MMQTEILVVGILITIIISVIMSIKFSNLKREHDQDSHDRQNIIDLAIEEKMHAVDLVNQNEIYKIQMKTKNEINEIKIIHEKKLHANTSTIDERINKINIEYEEKISRVKSMTNEITNKNNIMHDEKMHEMSMAHEHEKLEHEEVIHKKELEHREEIHKMNEEYEKRVIKERAKAKESSRSVLKGKIGEQMSPLFPGFYSKYELADARFLGSPIDYIIFKNMSEYDNKTKPEDMPIEIVFLEIKSSDSAGLTSKEKAIKKAVDSGKVRFDTVRQNIYTPQKELDEIRKSSEKEIEYHNIEPQKELEGIKELDEMEKLTEKELADHNIEPQKELEEIKELDEMEKLTEEELADHNIEPQKEPVDPTKDFE